MIQGGLFVDSFDGLIQGGDSGPAVVPGNPEESLLISALKHDSFKMPPKGKLQDKVIADFSHWISAGAQTPEAFKTNSLMAGSEIDLFIEECDASPPNPPTHHPSVARIDEQNKT